MSLQQELTERENAHFQPIRDPSKLIEFGKRWARSFRDTCLRRLAPFQWRALLRQEVIHLDLGAGPNRGSGQWTTVDMGGADIYWDLRKGIPLPDDCVDKIYTSHVLEHIPFDSLIPFLAECKRVLKPDGEFSVCVPNFRFYVDGYISGRDFLDRELWWKPARVDTGSRLDQVNYIAYMGGHHKYMFDEENLINTLKTAGFKHVRLRDFDGSIDLQQRDFESIYATASPV
ncbi:MAG: methyltransferase domain-containing protein [Pseudomonadota bacterium]